LATAPNQARVQKGRSFDLPGKSATPSITAADGQSYVGYERCTPNADPTLPGVCANREVLAGPVQPSTTSASTSGLYFLYYDKNGTAITDIANAAQIARIDVGIRTMSESLRKPPVPVLISPAVIPLLFTVGFRNRI